jgi:formylglycine-generating enzyme required for sulfatase activity/proteasome lid subunit RPN8/RPN11
MSQNDLIILPQSLQERFIATVKERLPRKSFGYFLSTPDTTTPSDFVLFEDNIRNSADWKGKFISYGQYFVEHDDAGFVATPEETWRLQKQIWARGMVEVGVFHSHLRHPANFSQIDYEMHMQRFHNLWHATISMRNPEFPQLRAFTVSKSGVRELKVIPAPPEIGEPPANGSLRNRAELNETIAQARQLLKLDEEGRPQRTNFKALFMSIDALLQTGHAEAIEEILFNGFLRDSAQRYEQHIAAQMRLLEGGSFQMGTNQACAQHFCGEAPRHAVKLSPFSISQAQITNELFGLLDQKRLDLSASERRKPVVEVTWFDAAVFAMWMGCRLPTEAEWEFACNSGADGEWCCVDESLLDKYAWYSENSGGETHPVGTRAANSFDLYDLHGNVWEWCLDSYAQDYYSGSPVSDPVNIASPSANKVCRGGSIHALSEMCRTRYRFHEPPAFKAMDLGFRLAKSNVTDLNKGENNGHAHAPFAPLRSVA